MGFFKKDIKKAEMAKPELSPVKIEPEQYNKPMVTSSINYPTNLYQGQSTIPLGYGQAPYNQNINYPQEVQSLNDDSPKSEILKHIKNLNSLREQIDEIRRRLNIMDEYLTLTLRDLYN